MTTKTGYTNTKPPASRLVLLSELSRIPPGTKVRFLGCITTYNAPSATLSLVDKYPATHPLTHAPAPKPGRTSRHASTTASAPPSHPPPHHASRITLDARLILPPTTPKELFRVGAWVCVLGYVAYPSGSTGLVSDAAASDRGKGQALVQALMLYPAGAGTASGGMQDARYVRAVEARRRGMRGMEDAKKRGADV